MADTQHALTVLPASGVDTYRMSTDAASISKAIVVRTAMEIQGRKYVKVEGWQAIALAHGCTASSCGVERVDGGFKAVGQVRRMDTGAVIAEAEGFVGEDEAVWFGGEVTRYGKKKLHEKRPDYAIRAMAQTRAISRACRSAFAHVVVMMDAGLQTMPAEEVPEGGFDDGPDNAMNAQARSLRVQPEDQHMVQGDGRNQYQVEKQKKAETFLSSALGTIALDGQTKDSLTSWWRDNAKFIERLEENYPDLHEKLVIAFDKAMDAAVAKVAA